MNNNDILIKLRYALDIKSSDMVEIFKLGGIELTGGEVDMMLSESNNENKKCEYSELESFLNGFIIFKRGKRDPKPGQPEKPVLSIKNGKSVNNVILKKLKIALSLSSEDMLDIFEEAGAALSKGELSNFFRKEGHKHYKACSDKYLMAFLNGLIQTGDFLL